MLLSIPSAANKSSLYKKHTKMDTTYCDYDQLSLLTVNTACISVTFVIAVSKIMSLPHDPRLVFGKPLLHFFSMVSLVTLYGLVAVLIELLSSLIYHSHIFRLVTLM